MDLGQIQVENGCFVEEEGSTYCFCDFNRCNAAGILDLRNLIDSGRQSPTTTSSYEPFLGPTTAMPKNDSVRLSPLSSSSSHFNEPISGHHEPLRLIDNLEIERDGFIELNRYPMGGGGDDDVIINLQTTATSTSSSAASTPVSSTTTTTTMPKITNRFQTILPTSAYLSTLGLSLSNMTFPTAVVYPNGSLSNSSGKKNATFFVSVTTPASTNVKSSQMTSTLPLNISTAFPFKTSYDPVLNNLDQLLIDYLNFSKSVNSYLITESIRQQILKRYILLYFRLFINIDSI